MNPLILLDVAPDPKNLVLAGAVLILFLVIALLVIACVVVAIVFIVRAVRKKKNRDGNPQDPFRQ